MLFACARFLVSVSGLQNRYWLLESNGLAKRPTLAPAEGGESELTKRWEDFWGTLLTCVGINHCEVWSIHIDTWVHTVLHKLTCNELLCALDWCTQSSGFIRFLEKDNNIGAASLPIEEDIISVPSPESRGDRGPHGFSLGPRSSLRRAD